MIPDLIYDVGMDNGDDTAYYLHKGYRVVAIEADPVTAEAGRQRFSAAIQQGKLTIVNCGVAADEGETTFWVCDDAPQLSSLIRPAPSVAATVMASEFPAGDLNPSWPNLASPFFSKRILRVLIISA